MGRRNEGVIMSGNKKGRYEGLFAMLDRHKIVYVESGFFLNLFNLQKLFF